MTASTTPVQATSPEARRAAMVVSSTPMSTNVAPVATSKAATKRPVTHDRGAGRCVGSALSSADRTGGLRYHRANARPPFATPLTDNAATMAYYLLTHNYS